MWRPKQRQNVPHRSRICNDASVLLLLLTWTLRHHNVKGATDMACDGYEPQDTSSIMLKQLHESVPRTPNKRTLRQSSSKLHVGVHKPDLYLWVKVKPINQVRLCRVREMCLILGLLPFYYYFDNCVVVFKLRKSNALWRDCLVLGGT